MSSPEYEHIAVLLRLPFLKERTSDELNYAKNVIEFLSHMGIQISYIYKYIYI